MQTELAPCQSTLIQSSHRMIFTSSYLNFAKNPSLFFASCEKPSCRVHLLRYQDERYYWIPCEAGPAFLDLVLYVSQMRSRATPETVHTPYEVKINQVLEHEAVFGRDVSNATIVFDKPVPNGEATMIVLLDKGRKVPMSLWPVSKDDQKVVKLGEPTNRLKVQWSPEKDRVSVQQLPQRTALIYSHDFPKEAPVPDPVLKQIASDINQIRVNVQLGNVAVTP